VRLFPGIFAGLLASVTVVAAFACVVAVVRPGADETTSLPSRVAPESVGRPLRIPAAPTAAPKLDVVPAARALSGPAVLVAPHRAATPRQAERAPASVPQSTDAPKSSAAPEPPREATPAPSESPAAGPAPEQQQQQQRRQNPVAAVAQNTTAAAARAVEPVSPQIAATVEQTGDRVADLLGPP